MQAQQAVPVANPTAPASLFYHTHVGAHVKHKLRLLYSVQIVQADLHT